MHHGNRSPSFAMDPVNSLPTAVSSTWTPIASAKEPSLAPSSSSQRRRLPVKTQYSAISALLQEFKELEYHQPLKKDRQNAEDAEEELIAEKLPWPMYAFAQRPNRSKTWRKKLVESAVSK